MQIPRRISGLPLSVGVATAIWLLLVAAIPGQLAIIEERSADWIWRFFASADSERRVIVVDIDESSLQQIGPWPWPREKIAQLSDRLASSGAALQVFDVVFPTATKDDAQLARTLGAHGAVLSQILAIQGGGPTRQGQVSSPMDWPACPGFFPAAENYIANAAAFSGLPAGHITPIVADDGSVRRLPAFICHDKKAYPALFLAAAMAGTHNDRLTGGGGQGPFGPFWQLQGLGLSGSGVPVDDSGNVRIPWWVDPQAITAVSARRVLSGELPPRIFENAWVLVGSTALGVNDRIATPFSGIDAGLQVHAQLLIGLLDDRIPATPQNAWLYGLFVVLVGSVLLAWLRRSKPIAGLLVGSLIVAAAAYFLKALLLVRFAIWVDWVSGALYVLLLATTLSLGEHARSRLERDRIYAHLSSYLPAPVAAALAVRDPSSAIDASRRNVIALYADIRNFSAYSELRPADETAAVLHAFISAATTIIEAHGGTIQSIQGDGVLAIWGQAESADGGGTATGDTLEAKADSALAAARELVKASHDLLPNPDPERLQSLALGIGIESGLATVGSFGLARRRTHLALGRAVTIAVRLEQMTAELAHPILIGENLAAYLSAHQLESQGIFLLEGIVSPCHIYAYPLKYCV